MAENAACGSDVSTFGSDEICKVCAHPAREHASWKAVGGRGERQTYVPTSTEHDIAQGARDAMQRDAARARKTIAPDERRAYVPTLIEDLDKTRAEFIAREFIARARKNKEAEATLFGVDQPPEQERLRGVRYPPDAARKDDAGKPRWSLLFRDFRPALEAIIRIREHGIEKYGREDSWKDVPDGEARYVEALVRHVVAYAGGEDLDPDSGEPHLAHAGINVLFLLWHRARRLARGG